MTVSVRATVKLTVKLTVTVTVKLEVSWRCGELMTNTCYIS